MTTTQGWVYHLTNGGEGLALDTDPAFAGLITFRPPDEGVPPIVPDAPPVDDSGLLGEPPRSAGAFETVTTANESKVSVPLVSRIRSRLVHGTTLELRFHLAVKARVRLLAKRRSRIVAKTPLRVLAGGERKLVLKLDRRRWPTKLDLQTHALAKLPTTSTRTPGTNSVSTGLVALPRTPAFSKLGPLG